jgi:hypothetical protein
MKVVEDKLDQAQRLITQAFSIMQYINADSSTAKEHYYPGQYTSPKGVEECQD